jgi:hypothetical protein
MKIVYAMCSPRQLEVYLTDKREAVPTGATVFAICTGERTIENQDEDLFAAISDEEYYTLREMVNKAEHLEAKPPRAVSLTAGQRIIKFLRQLFTLLFGKSARPRSQSREFLTSRVRTIIPMRL